MKSKIIQSFNRGAKSYNTTANLQSYVASTLANRLTEVSAKSILEIGCGTGLLSQHLISLFPHASLLLTDIAHNMVKTCNERFSHLSNVKTLYVDGEDIADLPSYDLITSSMVMHWFDDFNASFKKITEKLSLGGRLSFAIPGEGSLIEWQDICSHMGIESGVREFPSYESIKGVFPHAQMHKETIQYDYESAFDFLCSLKELGANAPHKNYVPMSSAKLKEILRNHSRKIKITYEIIYGDYIKC